MEYNWLEFPPGASHLYLYRSLKRSVRWELSDKWLLLPWQPWPWPAAATMSSPLPAPAAWSAWAAHNILTNSQYPYKFTISLYTHTNTVHYMGQSFPTCPQ